VAHVDAQVANVKVFGQVEPIAETKAAVVQVNAANARR
jgi:hypothetical protein